MSISMTVALVRLREVLDESTARAWTDVNLRAWINEGLRDVARRTRCLPDRDDVTVVAGTQEYTAPTDAVVIHRVEYRQTGDSQVFPLEYRDFNAMDEVWWTHQAISQSRPVIYTQWGSPPAVKIILYPKPSVAGTLKVFHFRLPAEISTAGSQDANLLEIPEGWEDVALMYAEYRALRRDRDPRWQEAKGLYEERLSDLHDTAIRYSDQSGQVVANGHSFVPSWLWAG